MLYYYSNFDNLTNIEKETLDLTNPFSLYSNSIRISTFEKLNLLERETCQLLRQKLVGQTGEIQFYKS